LLSKLLINRGITQPDSAKKFLSSSLNELTPPFLMKDLKKAARRIIEAIYQKEKMLSLAIMMLMASREPPF